MITLKHLVLGAGAIRTRPGPYLESWPNIVLFVVVVAVLGGVVAIWTAVAHSGQEHRAIPSREGRLVQGEPTRTTAVVRPRCVPSDDIALC
jgi:hypothetical protein